MTLTNDSKAISKQLNSSDSNLRREALELFLNNDLPDELIPDVAKCILDSDKGVRDLVSTVLISHNNEQIPKQVVNYVSSKDIASRNLAGEILLKKGNISVKPMIEYIPIGDDDDKKFVIDIMGLIGDSDPVVDILKVLTENKNENVILSCLEALGNIAADEAIKDLIKFYDENELYQPTIIEAIGKIGSEESVQFLIKKYSEVDELSKFSIIETLGLIGDNDAFFLLLSELKNLDGPMAWAAVESLNLLMHKLNLDIPFDESMKNSLVKALLDGDMKFKKASAELLVSFNDNDVVCASLKVLGEDNELDETLKKMFYENSDTTIIKIIEYLKDHTGNYTTYIELIKELLQFTEGAVVLNLSELDKRNLCDIYAKCLDEPDENLRRDCIELLFFTSLETAFLFIDSMVSDDNIWNRLRVIEILESIGDDRSIETIKQLSKDPEEMVREKALSIISDHGISNLEIKA